VSEMNLISEKLNSVRLITRMEMVIETFVYFITDQNDPCKQGWK